MHAREIIIEKPATLDAGGAFADKDFKPGDVPTQKDPKPGADGTNGDNGTVGGNAGTVVIDAHHFVNKTSGSKTQSVAELNALGPQILAEHPLKIDNNASLPSIEIGKMTIYSNWLRLRACARSAKVKAGTCPVNGAPLNFSGPPAGPDSPLLPVL